MNDWGGGKHPLVFIPPWHYFPSPTRYPYIPHLYTYTFSISWGSIIYYSDTLGLLQFCGSSRSAVVSALPHSYIYLYRCSPHLVQTLIKKYGGATEYNEIKKICNIHTKIKKWPFPQSITKLEKMSCIFALKTIFKEYMAYLRSCKRTTLYIKQTLSLVSLKTKQKSSIYYVFVS